MNKHDSLATTADHLEILLEKVPFFSGLDRVSLARLCGTLQELRLSGGVAIIDEGAEADSMYLLESGRVEVSVKRADGERTLAQLEAPAYFGEIGLLLSRRSGSVRSLTDVVLWKIPRDGFERVVAERPAVALAVAASAVELLERRQREMIGAPVEKPSAPRRPTFVLAPRTRSTVWRIVGFALAVGVPLALWALPPPGGLSVRGWHVSLVLLGAAVGWLAEPLPDFIIALLMAAVWGVAGLAPVSLAFAGFTTSSWIVALGALGLALAMASSGLLFRIALLFLRTFPPTHGGQVLALLLGGLVVTPVVPLALARIAAVAPLARELAEALGYPARSRARAGVAFAALAGYGLFSSVFLSGLVMNFFVVDLLPEAQRVQYSWLFWLASAAPAGAVVLVGGALMVLRLFRAEAPPRATAEVLRRQQQVLGPLSRPERFLLAALGILVIGLILQPILHVDAAWVTIGALTVATAGSALDRERFRASIDWGFLTFFGVLLGAGGVLHSVDVDRWIADSLVPIASVIGNPAALVMVLSLLTVGVRLVVPWIPATLLLSLALVPAAPRLGLSPWVVGFVVLMACNTWLHPSQSDFCRLMRDASGTILFTERQALTAGVALTAVTLLALAVSIPFWQAIGILHP